MACANEDVPVSGHSYGLLRPFLHQNLPVNSYRANRRSIYLKLELDSSSDCDLPNVKPLDGVSPVSFKSAQVSQTILSSARASAEIAKPF